MNFNDISERLDRLYNSIDKRFDGLIQDHVRVTRSDEGQYLLTFDKNENMADNTDIIFLIIDHLAKLKDHIKNNIRKKGSDDKVIENEINDSFPMQLIIDISNAEKHGYPLTRNERSGVSPKLLNIRKDLVIPPQKQLGLNLKTGEVIEWNGCYIMVNADVIDKNGELVYGIGQMINEGITFWESMIDKYDVTDQLCGQRSATMPKKHTGLYFVK